jgi:hypothetical protein
MKFIVIDKVTGEPAKNQSRFFLRADGALFRDADPHGADMSGCVKIYGMDSERYELREVEEYQKTPVICDTIECPDCGLEFSVDCECPVCKGHWLRRKQQT